MNLKRNIHRGFLSLLLVFSMGALAHPCASLFENGIVHFSEWSKFKVSTGSGSEHYIGEWSAKRYLLKTPDLAVPETGIRNEVLYYQTSEFFRFGVVSETLGATADLPKRGQTEVSAQQWIPNAVPLLTRWEMVWRTTLDQRHMLKRKLLSLKGETTRDDLYAIITLDFLLGQVDRVLYGQNWGNIILTEDGHLFAIDNSRLYLEGRSRTLWNGEKVHDAIPGMFEAGLREFAAKSDLKAKLESFHSRLEELGPKWRLSVQEVQTIRERIEDFINKYCP